MQAHASARIIISRNIPDKCGPNAGARARVLALGRTRFLHNNNQMKYVRMMGLWWLNGGDSLCPGARFGAERCVCVCPHAHCDHFIIMAACAALVRAPCPVRADCALMWPYIIHWQWLLSVWPTWAQGKISQM